MADYTIEETYTLPSKGLIYDKPINPTVRIRSMTTEEEMKRLSHSEKPHQITSEIIDDCLVEKPGISSYDMCIGDFQYLFYKLRTVTYGSEYPIRIRCPYCDEVSDKTINLDDLDVVEYSKDLVDKYLNITLPVSKKQVELRLQTPRMLDEIALKTKSKTASQGSAILYTVMSAISKIDGEVLDQITLERFVRALPMKDTNYILQALGKINIGINQIIEATCPICERDFEMTLPINGEFFGPDIE